MNQLLNDVLSQRIGHSASPESISVNGVAILPVNGNALLTRLIDVRSLSEDTKCRLYLPDGSRDRIEYLTLSHRWGGADIFKLSKTTIGSMLQGIDLDKLPLTFQHAILITRKLGYRYIWIDSLCIIQDDPSDWAFESRTMSRIYSNSLLTIAALWGDNSHSGCFIERNPITTEDCHIGKSEHGDAFVRSGDCRRGQSLTLVEPTPLLKRGWVLQERFLSPRTLYYGPWEILWECGARVASETEPESTVMLGSDGALKGRFRDMKRALDLDSDDQYLKPEMEDIYNIWIEIRAIYWSSQLTHHSDTLVAITGIITVMEHKTSMRFLSGLCRDFIYSELLWKVGNASETSRSTLCQTWSWASVNGARLTSVYDYEMYSSTSNILIWVEPVDELASELPGLGVSNRRGGLHIHGPLLRATLERNQHGDFTTNSTRLPTYGYHPDIPLDEWTQVFCLVVVEWDSFLRDDLSMAPPCYAGLILVPTRSKASVYERVDYERVGVWSCESPIGSDWVKVESADWQSFQLV
ncbi:MAG: hypothetical protein Q9208_007188 [Pyrenodesmia sp. 3 TL-2023]